MRHQDLDYLYRVARQMMTKFNARKLVEDGYIRTTGSGESYVEHLGACVRGELRKWKPETLGKLAALGRGYGDSDSEDEPSDSRNRRPLYEMHCGSWLGKYQSGYSLLLEIATTTVLAAICDLIEQPEPAKAPDWMSDHSPTPRRGRPIPNARDYALVGSRGHR